MPRMDGITATKEILKFCWNNDIHKPNIVALTAFESA
jgi:CheY-like chemotaxis protein